VQNLLCIQVLRSPVLAVSLHGTPAVDVSQTLGHAPRNGVRELLQRCHLYSPGRLSRWASAHILLSNCNHMASQIFVDRVAQRQAICF